MDHEEYAVTTFFFEVELYNEDKVFNMTRAWDKEKNSKSPTGIEPMASQIPVGRSNQLSYERLVVSWAILLG